MAFHKQTIRDIDLAGKRVLVRVDYNVPLEEGVITDDYRIQKSLPTIEYLREQGCKVILCSHLGRPEGKRDMRYTLRPCADALSKMLDTPVHFGEDITGDSTRTQANALKAGEVMLLENVRFDPREEANDQEFARELAELAEVFVQDAFGVVHHAAVSVSEIPKYLPAVAGLLVENEVTSITHVMESPERPLMAVIGGSKISDKIAILDRLVDVADFVVVGGAMANTFLLALDIPVGKSKTEAGEVPLAKQIIAKARQKAESNKFVFYIPQDGVVARVVDKAATTRIVDWDAHVIASIESYPKLPPRQSSEVAEDEMILDVGPFSASFIAGGMQLAQTVVWNGALGVTEVEGLQGPIGPFSHGTETLVEAMLGQFGHKPFTLLGGGDTVGYVESRGLTGAFNHVSTGGGASMELMSGKALPGVEALLDKQ